LLCSAQHRGEEEEEEDAEEGVAMMEVNQAVLMELRNPLAKMETNLFVLMALT